MGEKYSKLFSAGGFDESAPPIAYVSLSVGPIWGDVSNPGFLAMSTAHALQFLNFNPAVGVYGAPIEISGSGFFRGCVLLNWGVTIDLSLRITIDGHVTEFVKPGASTGYGLTTGPVWPSLAIRFNESLKIEGRRSSASSNITLATTYSLDRS
ncbi:MAG: hypothetical protein KJZ96_15680 [Rhodocyclaceae bacterium]|nr:hypothetical protein [Rhodocyclaceae bacterium]